MKRRVLLWLDDHRFAPRARYERWILFSVKPWRHARAARRHR